MARKKLQQPQSKQQRPIGTETNSDKLSYFGNWSSILGFLFAVMLFVGVGAAVNNNYSASSSNQSGGVSAGNIGNVTIINNDTASGTKDTLSAIQTQNAKIQAQMQALIKQTETEELIAQLKDKYQYGFQVFGIDSSFNIFPSQAFSEDYVVDWGTAKVGCDASGSITIRLPDYYGKKNGNRFGNNEVCMALKKGAYFSPFAVGDVAITVEVIEVKDGNAICAIGFSKI